MKRRPTVLRLCAGCGRTKMVRVDTIKESGNYCSRECWRRSRKREFPIACKQCGKTFYVAEYRKGTAAYCSGHCRSIGLYPKAKASGFGAKEGGVPWNKGVPSSLETREKLSKAHMGQKPSNTGRGNPARRRLCKNISSAVSRSITKGVKKSRRWESLVGWTIYDFKKRMQRLLKTGMTWNNYGQAWHVDHIIPVSAFNFKVPEDADFRRCWALTNLQPLWKLDNLKKNARLERPFQPMLGLRGG
jgi:hypothetical protein